MPEFLAETYAPRGAAPRAGEAALAAEQVSRPGAPVRFLGAVVPGEETCFCLYQGPSAGAGREAMTGARLRPEPITQGRDDQATPHLPGPRTRTRTRTQATRPPALSPHRQGTSSRPPQFPAAALFASDLPSRRHLGEAAVEAAISSARTAGGGIDGCVSALAAAYGDHPETAVPRM